MKFKKLQSRMGGSRGRGGGWQGVQALTPGKSQVAIGFSRNSRGRFARPYVKYVDDYKNKRGHGLLDRSLESLSGGEDVYHKI